MFKLKATLVATAAVAPWRTGWSVARGVDFSLARPAERPAARTAAPPCERACFIDEDGLPPAGATTVVRRFTSLAAAGPGPVPAPEAGPETGMRGWWSLAGKPSRT